MAGRIGAFIGGLLVPPRAQILALAAAGIGIFGDVVDFFTDLVPRWLIGVGLAGLAIVAAAMCWPLFRAAADALKREDCRECNAARFGLYGALVFAVLSVPGGGESATAALGTRLGLVERDVAAVRETLEPQSIIARPRSMEDHFNNAFVYMHYRRDAASAVRETDALYALGAPKKIDAAQLYFDAHAATEARAATLSRMERIGSETRDATLLIIAARNAESADTRDRLVALARTIEPELPFAWWDPMIPQRMPRDTLTRPGEEAVRIRADIARIEKYQALAAASPVARWYFMPNMAGDAGSSVSMLLDTYRQTARQYEDMESGKFKRDILEKLKRERASGQL